MVEQQYLSGRGKMGTGAGRHPRIFEINPDSGYFVGVDVKEYSVDAAMINFNGEMIHHKDYPFSYEAVPGCIDTLSGIVKSFIRGTHIPSEKVLNICFNISGRVNPQTGYSYSMFNFSEEPLSDVLSRKIGTPVCIDNDTRAMTYGEYVKGCVGDEKDVLFINVSWGLGVGIIVDGNIYMGKSGFSGEFGHIPAFENDIICRCGKKGCLETEVSGQALIRKLTERVKAGESCIFSKDIKNGKVPSLKDVIKAVNEAEDPLCIDIIEEIGSNLGKHLASLINVFNPELVVVGGVLSATGDYILQPAKTAIRKHSLGIVSKDSFVTTSRLADKAGITGACMIARSRMINI